LFDVGEVLMRSFELPVDWIGTSAAWGVEKPSPEFFGRLVARCCCAAAEIAYVGDRLDNDVRPALSAGMASVFLRRGPWAHLAPRGAETRAHISVESLAELPGLLGQATS
jgi:FMN phosphatase YigB (HAD superfamily)